MATLQVNNGLTVDHTDEGWSEFKKWLDGTYATLRYVWVDEGPAYSVAALDAPIYRTFSINKADAGEFEAVYKHNHPLSPSTADGRPRVAMEKPDATKVTLYSHNWCDKTSWYEMAVRVVEEVATDSGDHQTYTLTNSGIIDTYHGKIMQEDFLLDVDDNSYRVAVTVDDVTKTEQDPHYGTGGDFTVNYPGGEINFLQTLSGTETVAVTYHHATAATYTVKSSPGQKLIMDAVEVQLSGDVVITDSVLFQPYGPVEIFAPQYCPTPYPSGTLIPLGNPLVFKGMGDYLVDANKAWPAYPAGIGGDSWRGMASSTYIFTWDYLSATEINGNLGLEIRLEMQHNAEFGGTYASASFYCRTEST